MTLFASAQPGEVHALERDAVDVWSVDLGHLDHRFTEVLSADELARAARFRREEARDRWVRARAVLRRLLARYTGLAPRTIVLRVGPHGKPELGRGPRELRFNLSHAGDVALYGFVWSSDIGIDVELIGRSIDWLRVAGRVFGREVLCELEKLDPRAQEWQFLRHWVRHEAVLKCHGIGLLDTASDKDRKNPWVMDLDLAVPGAVAALALADGPKRLRRRSWTISEER
jgi:4'-phosphopantetheinyl transferase